MSEHKPTPGPWTVHENDGSVHAADREICRTQSGGYYNTANARLIAAAPGLLAALERIESEANAEEVDPDDCRESIIKIARAAIGKALGR